jgi:uncharacterized protein (TIGR00730 family)
MIHRIAVFCGSSPGTNTRYMFLARKFGRALAEAGFGLVYGGGQVGLMGAVAGGALDCGGEVIGIIPDFLQSKEIVSRDPRIDLRIVSSMHARKALASSLAHGFVALPGGYGTFEELFEIVAWVKLGLVHGPVILLNDGGFYDRLLGFVDFAATEGFVSRRERDILIAEPTFEGTITRLLQAVGS